ncbi:DUF6220 domain-containing protein [Sinomonas sp. ASV486]|uniref:DUF6220 domain-containing protein n=1 Tax=Sinomonas sp. ASV486 TaxID=3051170 RepID=UPI0027DC5AC8|nr:DUF6220 domain-containing protein [Sinomonas sp. ASV486]MDQ4490883.1 DUF6220 domain-containing protein [Sinomonas sp. ASV486]
MRKAFLAVSALLFLDTIVQLYLAAFGTFALDLIPNHASFDYHAFNGQVVLRSLALLTILVAALARAGKNTIWLTVGIFLLTWVQLLVFIVGGMLTGAGPDNPSIPGAWAVATHAVTGLLIIFSCYWLLLRARRLDRTGSVTRPEKISAQAPAA